MEVAVNHPARAIFLSFIESNDLLGEWIFENEVSSPTHQRIKSVGVKERKHAHYREKKLILLPDHPNHRDREVADEHGIEVS